jgi:hypothetical protein
MKALKRIYLADTTDFDLFKNPKGDKEHHSHLLRGNHMITPRTE